MFSNTARTVENAANAMNTKNRLPHRRPIAMWLKMFGRVTKIRFGPLSGDTLNAKHAGKMIRPAVKATKGVEHSDVDRLAHQGAALADVAAENRHRADAERQGEERLIHRAHDHVRHAGLRHAAEVRDEVKAQTLARARGADAVDGSTTMMASSAIIMTLVTRSRPP